MWFEKYTLVRILQHEVIRKAGVSLAENLLTDFTSWYTNFIMDKTVWSVF